MQTGPGPDLVGALRCADPGNNTNSKDVGVGERRLLAAALGQVLLVSNPFASAGGQAAGTRPAKI